MPLKVYLGIAATGDYGKLLISGYLAENELIRNWGEIVKRNSESTGTLEHATYTRLLKSYGVMDAEYKTTRAYLTMLMFAIDDDSIAWLAKKGYKIDATKPNALFSNEYQESLKNAQITVGNMTNKLKNKLKELKELKQDMKEGKGSMSLEEVLAHLSFQLGFPVEDSITLARYNEYNKILKKRKLKPVKENGIGSR